MDDDHPSKLSCPGCNTTTREVARGMREEGKCPKCGLGQDVLHEIWRVRETHATAEVKQQYEAMAVRAGKAEAEARRLARRLERIEEAVNNHGDY